MLFAGRSDRHLLHDFLVLDWQFLHLSVFSPHFEMNHACLLRFPAKLGLTGLISTNTGNR